MNLNIIPWDGKPISKPGFYSGVPMSSYHSGRLCVGPSLSSSGHRTIFTQSEAHFFDRSPLNPDHDPDADEDSESLILGRATHHLLLGQPNFLREFAVCPSITIDAKGNTVPWSLRTNAAKLWMEKRQAEGLTVLTEAMMEKIKGMALRLAREPLVKAGALDGVREITMAVIDPETRLWLLSRPDVIPTDGGDFTDVKTLGRDVVSYGALVRAIGDHGYHMQAALCGECYETLTGQKMASFSFYFIESKRPHCARMVTLKDADLILGTQQNRAARRRFIKAMNTGVWPGPGGLQDAVLRIDLSDAKRQAIKQQLAAEEAQ